MRAIVVVLLSYGLAGCGHNLQVVPKSLDVNLAPSRDEVSNAVFARNYRYDLTAIGGTVCILTQDGGKNIYSPYATPVTSPPTVSVEKSEKPFYHSMVTAQVSGDAKSAFGPAAVNINVNGDNALELTMTEIAEITIHTPQVGSQEFENRAKLAQLVERYYDKNKLYYVQGVTLIKVMSQFARHIDAKGEATAGPVVNVNGNYYDESSEAKTEYVMYIDPIPITAIDGTSEVVPAKAPKADDVANPVGSAALGAGQAPSVSIVMPTPNGPKIEAPQPSTVQPGV